MNSIRFCTPTLYIISIKLVVFAYEYFIFFERVTSPSAKPPFMEDQFVFLSLASHFSRSEVIEKN